MITTIVKRDGREVPFNLEKIANAIAKALQAVGASNDKLALSLASRVIEETDRDVTVQGTSPSVEQIQDIAEKVLISANLPEAAKAYILYRAERTRAREMNTRLMKTYDEIATSDSRQSNMKRDNANIDGDTAMGSMLKYGSEGAKIYNEMYILKPEHAKAHNDGDIHIHDFDFYTLTTTCCQIDLQKLFKDGFSTGHGYLREPNDIASYSALACIAIQSNQNDQHGGQSIPSFDYALADGVRKTFAKKYRENLAKSLEFSINDKEGITLKVYEVNKELASRLQLRPEIDNANAYEAEETRLLSGFIELSLLKKAQKFAREQALKEVDRLTYPCLK